MKIVPKLILIISICFVLSSVFFLFFQRWFAITYFEHGWSSLLGYNLMILLGFVLGLSLFIVLFVFSIRNKIKYIKYMEESIAKMSDENLGWTMNVKGRDELAGLAKSINAMSLALKQKLDEERENEKLKNELITNISHDLRSPLTTIIGFLRILKDKKYEDDHALDDYVNTSFEKAARLKKLMDDLFAYTKLSNKEIQMHLMDINLKDMLLQFVDEMSVVAEEKQLLIKSEFPKVAVPIKADPNQLLRVFENLMDNAIKYSIKPGTIHLKMELEDGKALITFGNKGHSISKEELPRIFERLYKMDKARLVDDDSSGLGLAISKSIIELHHGQIWAESHDDKIEFKIKLKMVE